MHGLIYMYKTNGKNIKNLADLHANYREAWLIGGASWVWAIFNPFELKVRKLYNFFYNFIFYNFYSSSTCSMPNSRTLKNAGLAAGFLTLLGAALYSVIIHPKLHPEIYSKFNDKMN